MKKDWHEDVVQSALAEAQERLQEELDDVLSFCQSPLEKVMLAKLYFSASYWYADWRGNQVHFSLNSTEKNFADDAFIHHPGGDFSICIMPQAKIGRYYVDIMINAVFQPLMDKQLKIVIECDGHDFHEKTKEQASKDKKRDRDLQKSGFIVFRYSGSDIYKNIDSCVEEISSFVGKFLEEQMENYYNLLRKRGG